MKNRKLLFILPLLLASVSVAGCGGGGGGGGGSDVKDIETFEYTGDLVGEGEIKVWVGTESVEYYQQAANDWVAAGKAKNAEFKYSVVVEGHDSGAAAGDMQNDPTVCADIFTVAHDNIGKLAAAKLAKPIVDKSIYDQVADQEPVGYQKVCKSIVSGTRALYGVPYVGQALFLLYNKDYVTAEQAKTFEGLKEAAAAASTTLGKKVKAVTVMGTDGFNFSFPILARTDATNETTFKLYENGEKTTGSTYFQGDDSIASSKWAQRYFADENGLTWPGSTGWELDIQNKAVLSLVAGTWKFNAFASAIGETKVGVAMIPTYTLTAADVEGTTMAAGTVMRGGTFADCKVLMINASSAASKYRAEQDLIKYFESKEVQNGSFRECDNLPTYIGADEYIETIKDELSEASYGMAVAQNKMAKYGMPQPFVTGTLNSYYYSQGAPALYEMIITNENGDYSATAKIREMHYRIQYIWQKGKEASSVPSSLPAEI